MEMPLTAEIAIRTRYHGRGLADTSEHSSGIREELRKSRMSSPIEKINMGRRHLRSKKCSEGSRSKCRWKLLIYTLEPGNEKYQLANQT